MRALVVGGTGFVGINVVDELLARGASVRVTRRKRSPTILLAKRPVEFADACLEDRDALERAMRGCDAVFLTGAHYPRYSLDPAGSIATGVAGVRNACEAARAARVSRLVYTSSVGSLSRAPTGRAADERDIAEPDPRASTYRAVKWAMERELERHEGGGLSTVTLLPGGCVGPYDARVGTGGFLLGVARSELPWWVDGTVNLVDVADVARAHWLALDAPSRSRYCLGGHDVSLRWLLPHIAERFGGRAPERELTAAEARARADDDERHASVTGARVAVPRELVDLITTGQPVSNARAARELGLSFGALDDALDRAHRWYLRFRYLKPLSGPDAPPRSTP
jgi:dihydroflavonol-4-reductase